MENNQLENKDLKELTEKQSTAEKLKLFKEKYFKKSNFFIAIILLAVLSVCLVINKSSNGLGSGIGNIAGKVTGYHNGIEDAKKDVITKPDVAVELRTAFNNLNVLEVYEIQCKVSEFLAQEKNKKDSYDYAAIYACEGKVVFKVDLNKVEIEPDGTNRFRILIPHPVCEFIDDISTREKLAEYSKNKNTGDIYITLVEWMNERRTVKKRVQKKFSEDESVLLSADEAAKNQIKQLCENVSATGATFTVIFKEG